MPEAAWWHIYICIFMTLMENLQNVYDFSKLELAVKSVNFVIVNYSKMLFSISTEKTLNLIKLFKRFCDCLTTLFFLF